MSRQPLYSAKVFPMAGAKSVIFFVCPYTSTITQLNWAIKRLQKDNYVVVAYDIANRVIDGGDPALLGQVIAEVQADIAQRVAEFEAAGISDFGFFGSSLGAFVIYNCLSAVPQLAWGVFNTGGNAAKSAWKFPKVRKSFIKAGVTLEQLEHAWHPLQFPDFKGLADKRFLFFSSYQDRLAPLREITQYLEPFTQAGAKVEILSTTAVGHVSAVMRGLLSCRRLVALVRSGES